MAFRKILQQKQQQKLLLLQLILVLRPMLAVAQSTAACTYFIEVRTSCDNSFIPVTGYGTDGEVTVHIGDAFNGQVSGNQVTFADLNNSGDDFENCDLDKFVREGRCINFCSLMLKLEVTSIAEMASDWRVDYVNVIGSNNVTKLFAVDSWLRPRKQANSQSGNTAVLHLDAGCK